MVRGVTLQDGPLAGHEINVPGYVASIVLPESESCNDSDCLALHFIQHHYSHDGTWLHSETYVGYESDDTIARREAYWQNAYWEDLARTSEQSFA